MRRKILIILLSVLLLLPTVTVFAEENTESAEEDEIIRQYEIRVYLNRDYSDCMFNVSWQNTEKAALIELFDPDNNNVAANFKFENGFASTVIANAKKGYWRVVVTGGGLGIINVTGGNESESASDRPQNNIIKYLTVNINGQKAESSWAIESQSSECYAALYAVQGNNTRQVWSDYKCKLKGSRVDSVSNLTTGYYKFRLEVSDENESYTYETPAMYIKSVNAPEKLNNIKAGGVDGEYYISWDSVNNEHYSVILYDYETLNVIDNIDSYESPVKINLDNNWDKIKYSVAVSGYNYSGEFELYDLIKSEPQGTVFFPQAAVTHDNSVPIEFSCPDNVTGGIYYDGEQIIRGIENGSYRLNLSGEGDHSIIAFLEDQNGNMCTFKKKITFDNTPPDIITECKDSFETSSETFIITGSTEPNAVLMINGVEFDLAGGCFSTKVNLETGNNTITLSAYDTAGNKTVKTITITRIGKEFNLTVFSIPAVVLVILAAWYIILNINARKEKTE